MRLFSTWYLLFKASAECGGGTQRKYSDLSLGKEGLMTARGQQRRFRNEPWLSRWWRETGEGTRLEGSSVWTLGGWKVARRTATGGAARRSSAACSSPHEHLLVCLFLLWSGENGISGACLPGLLWKQKWDRKRVFWKRLRAVSLSWKITNSAPSQFAACNVCLPVCGHNLKCFQRGLYCPVHFRPYHSLILFHVHGILQARILEGIAFPSPGDLPNPETELSSPALQEDSLPAEPQGKPILYARLLQISLRPA